MVERKDLDNLAGFEDREKKDKEELEKQKEKIEKQAMELRKNKEKNELLDEIKKKLVDMRFELENAWVWWKLVDEITNLIESWKITKEEIEDIFEKIDEILKANEKKKEIPQKYLFTKHDYLKALKSEEDRANLLSKLDNILDFTASKLQPVDNVFLLAGYYFLLDKKIQIIHDNCIDVKENLEKLNK